MRLAFVMTAFGVCLLTGSAFAQTANSPRQSRGFGLGARSGALHPGRYARFGYPYNYDAPGYARDRSYGDTDGALLSGRSTFETNDRCLSCDLSEAPL